MSGKAQLLRNPVAVPYTGLTAYSVHHTDAFSFTANKAALANVQSFSAGLYSERRFLLQELSLQQLALAIPSTSGNFGISGTYFGAVEQNETQIGLAYGRKLSERINIGTQFNYFTIRTADYGSASGVSMDVALLVALSEQFRAGIQLSNPYKAKIGKAGEERLPFIYTAGLGYEASENCFITASLEKAEGRTFNIKPALQYYLTNKITASGGIETATTSFYLGFGVSLRSFRLDAVTTVHPQLGVTPGLQFTYSPSKEKL